MTSTQKLQWLLAAVVFLALGFLPVIHQPYWLTIGISILTFSVLATSWALFSGPTHYISLATAAFYGLGAYVVGMGIESIWYPFLLVIATTLGAILALLVGWATLRLSGVYFVIFTLGLAEFIRQIITWVQNNFTGSQGVYVFTSIEDKHIFWELLVLAAVVTLFGVWLKQSRLGFSLRVIGGDEVVAAHVGIHSSKAKILLFAFSGGAAALTGAILAPRLSYIEPSMVFSVDLSFQVVIMALLGGVHRLWGPIVGVIPFTFLWEFISAVAPTQTVLLLGVAFLVIVYFIPNGIAGLIEKLVHSVERHE